VPAEQYEPVDVSLWEVVREEMSGVEPKWWLRDPATKDDWLFKTVTVKDGHVHGEDWAETAASHLAGLVGIPAAQVAMATRVDRATQVALQGSISLNLAPPLFDLLEGRLLLEAFPEYVHQPGRRGGHPGHSLENIRTILAEALPPPASLLPFAATAFDVFAGYLMFDAWIANTDRHDNNWSILRHATEQDQPIYLCGSYDHASSLGFGVLDDKRTMRLAEHERMIKWCEKGVASCFEHTPGQPIPSLVATARRALEMAAPRAMAHWLARLQKVSDADVHEIMFGIPGMSEPARNFAVSVLEINRRRVLDACS
jgi:hypothetical protein